MNNSEVKKLTTDILELELQKQDWFLVDCVVSNGRVIVAVDADTGFTIANCVRLSRLLESELNKLFQFSEQYSLEVGSPGMGNPLKVFRQYKKFNGRKVTVVTTEGERIEGRMVEVADEGIVIEKSKMEKKKEVITGQVEIPFTQIKTTTLVVTF